ncbi:hypothetical protein SpCBS45565_g02974 [Spizellomyces sp. 'palustris']|nr:hypothetical protein SpCBS45565_g02974 [Spizellomyces sp. 'palustris']
MSTVTPLEDTKEEEGITLVQKTRPFQPFQNDPNLRVYFALLTQMTEDDVDLLRSVRMDISPQRQVTLLLTHLKTAYEKNDLHLAEKLLGHILELASTFTLDTNQLASVAEMGQLLQLERGEKTPVLVAAVLEQVYMQLRSSQVLPRTDFMKRIFVLLLRGRYEHTSVLLQDFAARLLNMLQQGAITDVEHGGMLCCLSQMVSQCFQIMDAMALGQDNGPGYDDVTLLDRMTQLPQLIEQLKETGYVLAAAVGDQNISSARVHFVDVLKKSGDIGLLRGVGGLVAGIVNGLLGNVKIHVVHFGAFAYITDSEAIHDPRFVDILPRLLKTSTPSSSHLVRPELVPNILEFLKGVYTTLREMDPCDARGVGALGDVYFACGAVREAFCFYVMGLESASRGFMDIRQIQWYHLPRLVQCAEQSNEYLAATVFCQLYPTLVVHRTLGLLTKALSVRETQQWIVQDKGPVEGVVSVLWDVVVLEFAIGTPSVGRPPHVHQAPDGKAHPPVESVVSESENGKVHPPAEAFMSEVKTEKHILQQRPSWANPHAGHISSRGHPSSQPHAGHIRQQRPPVSTTPRRAHPPAEATRHQNAHKIAQPQAAAPPSAKPNPSSQIATHLLATLRAGGGRRATNRLSRVENGENGRAGICREGSRATRYYRRIWLAWPGWRGTHASL